MDYDKFGFLQNNRGIVPLHVNRIKHSMEEQFLISPICVNEEFEIIDGQHRFVASKELGKPIYYYICEGYGEKEVQRLNSFQSNWSIMDFLQFYIKRGYPEYIKLDNFMNEYNLRLPVARIIATDIVTICKRSEVFKDGGFKFSNAQADKIAKRYNSIRDFWEFSHQRSFVIAFVRIIQNPQLNWKRFRQSVDAYHYKVTARSTTSEYLKELNYMYNFRRKDKIRIYDGYEDL